MSFPSSWLSRFSFLTENQFLAGKMESFLEEYGNGKTFYPLFCHKFTFNVYFARLFLSGEKYWSFTQLRTPVIAVHIRPNFWHIHFPGSIWQMAREREKKTQCGFQRSSYDGKRTGIRGNSHFLSLGTSEREAKRKL